MWQRFTEQARKVVFYAQEEAQRFGENYVSTEHIILGLVRETGSTAVRALELMGVSAKRVRAEVEKQLPRGDDRPSQNMSLTPRAKRVIDLAYDEARNINNNYIGTEHILLGLIREGDGLAGRVLDKLGVTLEVARSTILSLQDKQPDMPGVGLPSEVTAIPRTTRLLASVLDFARWEVEMFEGSQSTEMRHVLLGIVRLEECLGMRLLIDLGVDPTELRKALDEGRNRRERGSGAVRIYEGDVADLQARASSLHPDDQPTGTEHLVLAILNMSTIPEAMLLSERFGVTAKMYEQAIEDFYKGQPGPDAE